jgi:hypothetical protein
MTRNKIVRTAVASAFAMGALSGCQTWHSVTSYVSSDNATTCPDAAILASTSALPAFDPAAGPDPSSLIYTVAMTGVKTRCDYSKRDFIADTNVTVYFHASRPPGGEQVSYRVPYYVAITNNGEIKDKQVHWLSFEFPKGAPSAVAQDFVNSVEVQVDKTKKPYEYHLIVGFQLTKAQLEYNKKMGQYEP